MVHTCQKSFLFISIFVGLLLVSRSLANPSASQGEAKPDIKEETAPSNDPQSSQTPTSDNKTEDIQEEEAVIKPKTRRIPVPQFEGEKFVLNLTEEAFDSTVKHSQSIVLIAAKWCPHCRNYLPDFNRLAYDVTMDESHIGKGWKFGRYFTQDMDTTQRDPLMKKFDLDAVPKLLIIKDNRYWVYDSTDKVFDKVVGFVANLDYQKSRLYPSYVPDFYDNFRTFFREIKRGIDITIEEQPETFTKFKVFCGVVTAVFGFFLILAIFSGGKKEDHVKKEK